MVMTENRLLHLTLKSDTAFSKLLSTSNRRPVITCRSLRFLMSEQNIHTRDSVIATILQIDLQTEKYFDRWSTLRLWYKDFHTQTSQEEDKFFLSQEHFWLFQCKRKVLGSISFRYFIDETLTPVWHCSEAGWSPTSDSLVSIRESFC